MIFFWFLYFSFSLAISFLVSFLFKNKTLRKIIFWITFSSSFAVWFIKPGSTDIAPVTSIALLELLILEEHGFVRLLRPFAALVVFSIIFQLFINFFFKKK